MKKNEFDDLLHCEVYKGKKRSLFKKFFFKYLNPSTNAIYLFRKMQYVDSNKGRSVFSKIRVFLIQRELAIKYGINISPSARIGKGLHFPHPTSIVIGACVNAGENLTVYQNTTIGGARKGDVKKNNQPIIGNNCTLFAGAMILGKVSVGDNVIIGANSCLLESVDDNCICVGSPAKSINRKG